MLHNVNFWAILECKSITSNISKIQVNFTSLSRWSYLLMVNKQLSPFQITVLFLWTRTVIYFPSKSLYEAFLLTHSSSLTYWLTHFLSLSLSYSYSVVLPSYLKWVFSARLSAWALMLTHNGAWLNSLYQVKFLVCVPFYRTRRALSVSQISPLTINVQCYSL